MPPKILVVRLSSLGDIVLTLPVYRSLKARWPGCRTAALVKPQYAAVLEGHPEVDEVIAYRGLADALSRIRAGGFTHLLDLHATFRSWLLSRLSGVPQRLRYRKDALARRLFVVLGRRSAALARHTMDRYLECLAAWGVPAGDRDLALPPGSLSPKPSGSPPGRVLVVQTAFLGDATLTLPLLQSLKAQAPRSHLAVLTRPDTADVFRACPAVDEVLVDDKRGSGAGVRGFSALWRRLKAGRFDLAVVPHRSWRSALAVRLAGIPERVGFSTIAGRLLFTRTVPFLWGMHDLERNLSLAAPSRGQGPVYLAAGDARARDIARRLEAAGAPAGAALVGMHPGSVWPTKRWPAERFGALARRLAAELGAKVVLVGGAPDAALAAQVAREAGAGVLDWTGKTTMAELIALMPRLSLFVTNDSGPMHVATASGVPTVAFFGPTTRELGFFPYGPGHAVLEAELPCRPCGLHGAQACPRGHFLCMRLISVEDAFRAAAGRLRRPEAAPAR